MKLDENGNPIEDSTDNPIVETADETTPEQNEGDFVDNMISHLLTDEEKEQVTSLGKEDSKEENPEGTTEVVEAAPAEDKPTETTEVKTEDTPGPAEKHAGKKFNVNGVEVSYEQLTDGYLRQADYTKKTQELANDRAKMEPYQVLNEHLAKNPQDFQRVVDLLRQGAQQPQQQAPQRPEDPVDAIAFDATQNALSAMQAPLQGVSGEMSELKKQQAILQVKTAIMADPLRESTQQAMNDYVWNEYAPIHGEEDAKKFFSELDNNPREFAKLYQNMRKRVESTKQEAEKKPEAPIAVEKKTPFVADSSQEVSVPNKEKLKRKEINRLRNKTRGGKTEDVVNYLGAIGMVDHLS